MFEIIDHVLTFIAYSLEFEFVEVDTDNENIEIKFLIVSVK